ncbi:conserved Plasmodium membrane protein, unknown function [Plasmodium gallinaceum]|uniref:Uncharacterized protein n=1 Tax=Plasmodium gallinaceum TaxID=5849 RepID=A0A1J1GLY4_PLAGA|nr:conserved Plasmodium membrane protein, unknown function [Plasmodium gallinaceum]CRG93430.1 conserved Plasmodium membrane protein, unknown function [Plasmodium gallinaceum]
MKIFKLFLFTLILFFINLFFVKSSFKNDENFNIPLNVLFSKGNHMRKRVCNECFYKNEVNLIFHSCKAFENVKNNKINRKKIVYFIKESPRFIKKFVSMKSKSNIYEILSMKTLRIFLLNKTTLLLNGFNLLKYTYLRYNYTRSILGFFQTILLRFLVVYFIQLCSSFLLFHYFNMFSQKTQAYVLHISGSKIISRIIGFLELNLINYYINIFSEIIQILIIRMLFKQHDVCLIKTLLYNSEDYLVHTNLKNKYAILYQCAKNFVITRINKLSLFTFNYLRYFVLTNLFFKFFDGTYNKFSPSDVKMPGVYSDTKKSLEKDMKYATKKEIDILRNFCKHTGCHTCGVVCHEKFIGDHQPPIQVIKDMIEYYKDKKFKLYFLKLFKLYDTKQRLYPQCVRCSQIQSASVRCKKLKLIPHYYTIRIFHFSIIFHLFLKMILLTNWRKIIIWDGENVKPI